MSRPLTGTKRSNPGGSCTASLPKTRGSRERVTYTFVDEYAADRWLAVGCEAITSGGTPPEPIERDLVALSSRPGRHRGARTQFRTIAEEWVEEYYGELRRGGVEREETARRHIARIDAFMRGRRLYMETLVRPEVKAFQASLARSAMATKSAVPDGIDPERLVGLREAVGLPGMASESTLKRRIKDGVLVPVERSRAGNRYRVADLYAPAVIGDEGKLRRGPTPKGSLSQGVATDVMWVFEQVCLFARDHGVAVPQDRESLRMHRTDRPSRAKRQVVSLGQCAVIASRLHVVHQLALFSMRILGLRISEAYGIKVGEIYDQGPGLPGAVAVKEQGGRKFGTREQDGAVTQSEGKPNLKTEHSERMLAIPPMLMDLIRVVITVFHTDADGVVRPEARLIPGLRRRDAGGQGAFRSAVAAVAREIGVDCSPEEDSVNGAFSCQPHDMRRSLLSDLSRNKIEDITIKRTAGHVTGPSVLDRHYRLDDPEMRPAIEVAWVLEEELRAELPAGLMVPTVVRCTTGAQRHLAADRARIDTELVERGWLLVVTSQDGDPLLNAPEVATELGVTPKTARQWMASGLVPSFRRATRAAGEERCSRLSDVVKVRDQLQSRVSLHRIAEEVEQPYHTVYQYVRAQGLELHAWGAREYLVPAGTAEHLRQHYARQAALHRRAIPLSVAAAELSTTVAGVHRLLADGVLVADDRAHDGRRMVTRESVAAAATASSCRAGRRTDKTVRNDLMRWEEARQATGHTEAELSALVAQGVVERVQHQRRRHVTRVSLLRYLLEQAPEKVGVLQ